MTDNPTDSVVTDAWEFFCDVGYFDMWCVRKVGERRFGHGFHVMSEEEASGLAELLNTRMSQASSPPEAANEIERLREALTDIMEATAKRQLPLTDQIYRRCGAALSEGKPE